MPMNEYKIVNATQLDNDLARIANMIKTKTLDTKEYVFPDDFEEAVGKMSYNENPLGEDDLIIEGKSIIVPEGYYPEMVTKSINEGQVFVNNLLLTENPSVVLNEDGNIEVKYLVEKIPEFSVTPGYITMVSNVGYFRASGETVISPEEIFEVKDIDSVVDNGDGTITIPAGYYSTDVVYTLPTTE